MIQVLQCFAEARQVFKFFQRLLAGNELHRIQGRIQFEPLYEQLHFSRLNVLADKQGYF